ncbi:4-hydroxy-tetrahydrodipicolinate synthase [Halanaerobium saccharolyticum]|uniref:4-hydroxy-tetrahydrodipicolinate synthase n=1 Tax=Halanaerobium saccharolyticum TaxID=43595 RepID=A0A4R7YZD7_9FIRM|nr:dihydrodipicolinate synthase family protein [Halanaerobium saccharolyticum]RAK06956.1 4-hydroxy-tetrahydrodipicolinate synthase [Halanaerobium saccharolyticum]TDW01683.1 4-hydroxy-tetrahydrodipicolinate synthase [Halanaerobium saccharolyticum]TDX53081.1 4-hydroxy-tetrahydrodipicolinate synthase [Halanaerobium saccharolyticum]
MKAEIITPSLTIFNDDGSIDYGGNRKLIRHLIDNKVDGIVPLGSTGEFTSLSFKQKKDFIDFYLSEIDGSVKVLPGTGCINYQETIELSNFALAKGAEGVLIIGQYYYAMTQADIFHYYDYLAKQIEGNIYLYNFPARTGTDITPETVLRLLQNNKNIIGMKESVSTFTHTKDIMQLIKTEFPQFKMYSGFDNQFLDNIDYGGQGSIGGLSNILPGLWSKWANAKEDDLYNEVISIKEKILSLMKLYQIEYNCSGLFKELLKARGLDINTTTLFPFEDVKKESITEGLELISQVMDE